MTVTWKGAHSNNYTPGRSGQTIREVIVHWIVGTLSSADSTFQSPNRGASAHYGVGGSQVHQYVKEQDTAWHAGNWDVNLRSIGIEHEGGPNLPISEDTYKASAELMASISQRYNIPLDRQHVRGHREIKATQCPGTLDIDRLIRDAKKLIGGEVTNVAEKTITIKQELFEELVGKATKFDAFFNAGYSDVRVVTRRINELEREKVEEREKREVCETQLETTKEELRNTGSVEIQVPVESTTQGTPPIGSNQDGEKPFWKSKTVLANAAALVGLAIDYFSGSQVIKNPETAAAVIAGLNIVMRFLTNEPIKAKVPGK